MSNWNSEAREDGIEVRRSAAWFEAGVRAYATYSTVATIVVSSAAGLVFAILRADPAEAAVSTGVAILLANVAICLNLSFRSREVARTERVSVDQF